jgi:hypothetical protein
MPRKNALDEETQEKMEDKLLEELGAQGRHDNLSFFAFTATPKDKTLHMFGIKMPRVNIILTIFIPCARLLTKALS